MKMDKEVRRSFERKNLERAAKKAAVVGLTTLVLSTSGIQASAASRYDNSNYRGIGYISKVEEVSELGNGGYISTGAGDYGGVSYGIYQFSTTTGSARDFVNWTKKNDSEVYKYFKAEGNPRPSTAAFNRAWKKAYKELGTKFEKSQYDFASEYLIKPAYNRVKKRFGLDLKKSRAREEYLISTAVQFGPGGICNLFKEVENRGIKLDDNMDDSKLLSIMCNHKRDTVAYHFRSSSSAVKAAARQRFIREKKELLKISKEESGKTLDEMKETKTSTTKVSSSKETNDTSTEEFDDVIAVDDKDIEKDYDKVEKELDEIKDTISNETQDNTESKDEEDKSTTEDEDTSKEETTDESTKEDKAEEDNTESEDKEADTKEETKDEDKQESTENGSSLDNTLFVGDSHMKGAESTIKNNYDNSQVKATVGASAYVYLHDTKFFGEKLINSLPKDSDDIQQVVVSLGVNNITGATNESDVLKVLDKLQAKYPGKPIRFMLVNHVGNKYTEASVSKTNKLIDNLNKTVSNYAKEHENVSVIDASEGLETNGKLTSTNDGLHVNNNKKLLNNIEKAVEEKQDKTTLEEAPDQVKNNDEFDSIVDEDTTKDIEEPDKATEEDKQESTEKETTDEDKAEEKDNTEKEDKEADTKEESKDEDKSTESEKESSKEETTTEDNTVEEDNDKQETSKDESTKEDKSEEEKDYDTKEESSVKEDKQESTSEETKDNTEKESSKEDKVEEKDNVEKEDKETSKDESVKENKVEEKAVEEKQETSKEETPVKENKSTESEKETSKEDKVEEKDNTVKETKEETPAKEDKQESTEKESSKDESVKENKIEEKAVEQKQESSKEKEQPVQEEKTTEKQETKTEDNTKQEDNSTEQSSDTLNELQSRLSNNLFGKLMS